MDKDRINNENKIKDNNIEIIDQVITPNSSQEDDINSNKKENREKKILRTSIIGIIVNIGLAITKIILGSLTNSIAITTDAMNNLTDSSSSIITIIGTNLSSKKEDEKHPFGHGRIEYLTSMVIGIIVTITGIQVLISSAKDIFNPAQTNYTSISLIIMLITVVTKIFLGIYTENLGKQVNSGALIGSGKDAKNDAIITSLTIISALINIFFTSEIRKMIKSQEGILGAYDLIIHNYGPVYNMGSINVELDHETRVGDIYPILHRLQVDIYKKFNIYLIFGFYSVNENHKIARPLMDIINDYVSNNPHCLGYHGLYIDEETKSIYFDLLLDYAVDHAQVRDHVKELVMEKYLGYNVNINIDTKFI